MNDLTTTRELFAYTACADASVWTAVLHEAAASADGLVRDYLFHIHTVQGLFLAVRRPRFRLHRRKLPGSRSYSRRREAPTQGASVINC
jgi:hypothetical protein